MIAPAAVGPTNSALETKSNPFSLVFQVTVPVYGFTRMPRQL